MASTRCVMGESTLPLRLRSALSSTRAFSLSNTLIPWPALLVPPSAVLSSLSPNVLLKKNRSGNGYNLGMDRQV